MDGSLRVLAPVPDPGGVPELHPVVPGPTDSHPVRVPPVPSSSTRRYLRVKRFGDVFLAGGALLALSPVLLATAALVRARLGSPVLFRQERLGQGGRVFENLKFRSMLDPEPVRGLVSDAERMTPLGTVLRATSLDELPALVNVLRGEMSLVGPRPMPRRYRERLSSAQQRRHDLRPGLTGLAQVSGRNALSWDDRFDLDLRYVATCGPVTDLRLLLATVPAVLRREGVTDGNHTTMAEFFGPRRVGRLELRPVDEAESSGPFDVVDQEMGRVLARCQLRSMGGTGADEHELCIELLGAGGVDGAVAAELRTGAAEMMLDVARELDLPGVQLASPPGDPAREHLRSRLGFRGACDGGEPSAITLRHDLGRARR